MWDYEAIPSLGVPFEISNDSGERSEPFSIASTDSIDSGYMSTPGKFADCMRDMGRSNAPGEVEVEIAEVRQSIHFTQYS